MAQISHYHRTVSFFVTRKNVERDNTASYSKSAWTACRAALGLLALYAGSSVWAVTWTVAVLGLEDDPRNRQRNPSGV